jgi:hypothetical protein
MRERHAIYEAFGIYTPWALETLRPLQELNLMSLGGRGRRPKVE